MNRLQKVALLIHLIDEMAAHGSWCGEPHIQKAVYFLQELLEVPLGFSFIIYKHGPLSFDLRDELTELRADGLLDFRVRASMYGPSLVSTEWGRRLKARYPKTVAQYGEKINWLAEYLGGKRINELNELATALYVVKKSPSRSPEDIASTIRALIPYVWLETARKRVTEIQAILADGRRKE